VGSCQKCGLADSCHGDSDCDSDNCFSHYCIRSPIRGKPGEVCTRAMSGVRGAGEASVRVAFRVAHVLNELLLQRRQPETPSSFSNALGTRFPFPWSCGAANCTGRASWAWEAARAVAACVARLTKRHSAANETRTNQSAARR